MVEPLYLVNAKVSGLGSFEAILQSFHTCSEVLTHTRHFALMDRAKAIALAQKYSSETHASEIVSNTC